MIVRGFIHPCTTLALLIIGIRALLVKLTLVNITSLLEIWVTKADTVSLVTAHRLDAHRHQG